MKNLLFVFFPVLFILSSCKPKEKAIPVQSVKIDKGAAAYVHLGATLTLVATVLPDNATSKELTWTSSDHSTATVSGGIVTPVKEGDVTISATAGGITDNCKVTVRPPFVAVTGISLDYTTASLVVEDKSDLKATVAPANATDQIVEWTSDKEDIASVSEGVITAKAPGTCTITAKSAGDPTKRATCEVTVVAKGQEILVTAISLEPKTANILVNATRQLTVEVTPKNTTNKRVTWSSSDPTIAEVSLAGLVTAKKVGSATVTATAVSNAAITAGCTISVTDREVVVTGISVVPADTTLAVSASFKIKCSVLPPNATNVSVTYDSNDKAIATVSETGRVTAGAIGAATITVKSAADATKMATCRLTIKPSVASITLSPDAPTLAIGQKQQLAVTVMPHEAIKTVTWSSADPSKVTVSDSGEVTALALGQVRITATATDGSGITGSAMVRVPPKATSVSITPENRTVLKAETLQLSARILPDDAVQTVTWSSGDATIATINATTGLVTGREVGTTTITATAVDGSGEKVEVTLTVQANPNASTASITALTLGAENFVVVVPVPGVTTTLNNVPRTIASNLAEVQVNITATTGALIKIGTTDFSSGNTADFTNSITFTVTEAGKAGSKEYTLTITPYNKATNPYGIYSTAHLHDMRNALNEGFKLMADLTMPASNAVFPGISEYGTEGWPAIGGSDNPFTGSMDGAGHKIDNLYANRKTSIYAGLFGKVGSGGTIKNLAVNTTTEANKGVGGENRTARQYGGILAGQNFGTIEDCYTTGFVFAFAAATSGTQAHAGGLAGGHEGGQIRRCYSTATVISITGEGSLDCFSGGLVGYNAANISDCYATGGVQAFGTGGTNSSAYAGGLLGNCMGGTVERCYATGNTFAKSSSTETTKGSYAGGLMGHCYAQINNCYATGNSTVTATAGNYLVMVAGGFIGQVSSGSVSNSYAVGEAYATVGAENYRYVGGFCAYSHAAFTFTNCYRNYDAYTRVNGWSDTPSDYGKAGINSTYLADMKTEAQKNNLNQGQTAVWGRGVGKNNDLPFLIGVGVGK